jgi:hypothetical protein
VINAIAPRFSKSTGGEGEAFRAAAIAVLVIDEKRRKPEY